MEGRKVLLLNKIFLVLDTLEIEEVHQDTIEDLIEMVTIVIMTEDADKTSILLIISTRLFDFKDLLISECF